MALRSEPAVNALLGEALRAMHPQWRKHLHVESTRVLRNQQAHRPDVLICAPNSQSVVLETEFEPASTVERDALSRLGAIPEDRNEPIENAFAIRLPGALRRVDAAPFVRKATFEYCVFTDLDPYDQIQQSERWPRGGWLSGTLEDIAGCVETLMVSQRLIDESLRLLEQAVSVGANLMKDATSLGFVSIEKGFGRVLQQKPGPQTTRMAMVIIANAFAFHDTIAASFDLPSVSTIRHDDRKSCLDALRIAWRTIMREINYWPIFHVADLLLERFNYFWGERLIKILADGTTELTAMGVTTRHDMVGKMFQRLIVDRKFLATFYTRPTSAAMISELALARMDHDWQDLDRYDQLRVADLSCGTGTLLSAAYRSILARYRHAGGDDSTLHARMMEQSMIAADIMPAAAHLCASQLSSFHPTMTFGNTQVFTMPYGQWVDDEDNVESAIGSLDLIKADRLAALFSTGAEQVYGSVTGHAESAITIPEHSVDLVVMNPPFTRPTNHKMTDVPVPSFAGFDTSVKEQRAMSVRLKKLRAGLDRPMGNGNAGLASYFLDLAHVKVKEGGVLAFVIPKTILTGAAWAAAREVLHTDYHDLVVVSIASTGTGRQSFSADTDMAEVLLVAKRRSDAAGPSGDVLYVNLFDQPQTLLESMEVARACLGIDPASASGYLRAGTAVLASFVRATIRDGGCAALRNVELVRINQQLAGGILSLPRASQDYVLPTARLDLLGTRGKVDRDIYSSREQAPPFRGPFIVEPIVATPSYPVLWNHDSRRELTMVVKPDAGARVRAGSEHAARSVWDSATRLHLRRDLRFTSEYVAACLTRDVSLGGAAWPNFKCTELDWEPLLALWFNSTLGLMSYWWSGSRQHHGRARHTITTLPELTAVDTRALQARQVRRARDAFEQFETAQFMPANEAYRDEMRQALDRALLIDVLELPSDILPALDHVRLQWCSEPTVHGGKNTAPETR